MQFWSAVTYVVNFFTISPFSGPSGQGQAPILSSTHGQLEQLAEGPVFKPPTGRPAGPGSDFVCDYSNMPGFQPCSTADNRTCWLKNPKTGAVYDINTNYEDIKQTPIGVHRQYSLNLTDDWMNVDGINSTDVKIFNKTYPGPWLQACWGDVSTVFMVKHFVRQHLLTSCSRRSQ